MQNIQPSKIIIVCTTIFCFIMLSCRKEGSLESFGAIVETSNASIPVKDKPALDTILIDTREAKYLSPRTWQGVASVIVDNKKTIYVAWYCGVNGVSEGLGNFVTVSSSNDGGKIWKSNRIIIVPKDTLRGRCFEPCLWKNTKDEIYLFYSRSTTAFWDGVGGVWYTKITSVDNKISCTTPKWQSDGILLNKPLIDQERMNVQFPIANWIFYPTAKGSGGIFSYSYGIKDIAAVEFRSRIPSTDTVSYSEHSFIKVEKDKLLCYMRHKEGLFRSASIDNGHNWSEPEKVSGIGDIADSKSFVGKLKSGKFILIANNDKQRKKLTFFTSDDGYDWKKGYCIEEGSGYSYPEAYQTDDGKIHMVYDFGRAIGKAQIFYVDLNESDLMSATALNLRKVKVNTE